MAGEQLESSARGYRLYAIGSRASSEATAEPLTKHALLDLSAAGAVYREVPVLLRWVQLIKKILLVYRATKRR